MMKFYSINKNYNKIVIDEWYDTKLYKIEG